MLLTIFFCVLLYLMMMMSFHQKGINLTTFMELEKKKKYYLDEIKPKKFKAAI